MILILFGFSISYADDIFDDLLKSAYSEAKEDSLEDVFALAIMSFNDGIYSVAREKGERFLREYYKNDYKREAIIYMLSIIYYKNKDFRSLKKIFEENQEYLSLSTKQKIFQLINNYLVRKRRYKEIKYLRKKYHYLFAKPKPFEIINEKLKLFQPNVNIFLLKDEIYIGENELYIARRNTTLPIVAKSLDMGYDEMRYANPHINPFDIRKGDIIFVPKKRLLPKIDFEVGTIYLNLGEKRLYYPVKDDDGKILVITIPVGIGTDDNKSPIGEFRISEKRKNPSWYVPESIREENPDLPKVVPPGPDNPLGTRAMRLGKTSFLMHGTSKRFGIGMRVSHGCIRMYNRDVEKLFEVVKVGTKVVSTEQDYKYFIRDMRLYLEIHNLNKKQRKELLELLSKEGIDLDPNLLLFLSKEYRASLIILY
jgi:lipoprotein-anchoring transpeptidase ErfK/SrfK